ncbi:unnamed protein product, partial [Mesorhabditis belari]|uniref:Uncharacterized protein n=1 Tax=Mesorhabditis belari TaxID=2138241 RepID=A0AAF3ETF8_9BILA
MFLFLLIIGLFIDVCHGYLTWSFGGDDDDDYYSGRRYLGGSYGQPTVQQTYGQPFYGQPSYSPVTYSSVNMGGRSAGQCQVIRYLGNQYVDYLRTNKKTPFCPIEVIKTRHLFGSELI